MAELIGYLAKRCPCCKGFYVAAFRIDGEIYEICRDCRWCLNEEKFFKISKSLKETERK